VTRDEFERGPEVRRFFLGEMSEDERGAFEETFVADEKLFEQMRVAEEELIEAYVRGALAPSEREKFERGFLTTARRRARVEFTRSMLDKLAGQKAEVGAAKKAHGGAAANPSAWNSVANFFKSPALAFGTALALIVLVISAWLMLRNPNQPEVVRQAIPAPTVQRAQPGIDDNLPSGENVSPQSNASAQKEVHDDNSAPPTAKTETPNRDQNPAPRKPADGVVPVLALFAGAVRGEGATPVLNLPQGAQGARLRLRLESQDYQIYYAEIVNPEGVRVFQSSNLKARNSTVNIFVPASKLSSDDYLVKLSALNQQNELESVADYALRITRK
jgi:hypothetical protein